MLFVEPSTSCYERMIIGENSRPTTWTQTSPKRRSRPTSAPPPRTSSQNLIPPKRLSLEQSLEFCREDECVEVTPEQPYASARCT